MYFYTLIIDYKGGTYVCQAHALNLREAPANCIKNWDIADISEEITANMKRHILQTLSDNKDQDDHFALLNAMKNIWRNDIEINGSMMLMNLVQTNN